MMRRHFRRPDHSVPELNMASLPDLIFTVLFFFMIVTHMRDVEKRVQYQVPAGTEVEKAQHKSSVVHIYIGQPTDGSTDDYCIQLNNQIATTAEIARFIETERRRMSPEDQERLTVSIEADRDVPMSIINDVKQALRKSYALNVSYAATEEGASLVKE
jgi:biopolymer transport protein ExbD